MIHEVKFVWAWMITHLLPAGRRGENTALTRCNLISDVLAAYAAFAATTCATWSSLRPLVRGACSTSGRNEWTVFIEMSLLGKGSCTQRVYVWEEEWTVFIEMSSLGTCSCTQHVYVQEEEWTVIIEMSSLEKARAHSTFTSGKKSERYFLEMSSLVECLLGHSTFTSGKAEWAAVV